MAAQDWDDERFCEDYAARWEISTEEVHYGWLAPGEGDLGLLSDLALENANILDVGCGLGQNVLALCKKGAKGFGLDISPSMIDKSKTLAREEGLEDHTTFQIDDMRNFSSFEDIDFDLILSIYSMEYLNGITELRSVIHSIHKRLKPGGVFIMCFSHPSQAQRNMAVMNQSVSLGSGRYKTFNYSFKDAAEALFKAGFILERVVEQGTQDPSRLVYEDAKKYPYHFRDGFSPFVPEYDEFSNGAPHTVIYKARRHFDPTHGLPRQRNLDIGYRALWGVRRTITKVVTLKFLGLSFTAQFLAPRDNIVGVLDALSFAVTSDDLAARDEFEVELQGYGVVAFSSASVLGVIHRRMHRMGLDPIYRLYRVSVPGGRGFESRVIIEDIAGLGGLVKKTFSTEKLGLLVFVNGSEPSSGELPIDESRVRLGDHVTLMYVAFKPDSVSITDSQLALL